ncbi:MAG: 3-phosphoshikimate 1-carboxyvinyltransferase [bacterium]
MTQIRIEPVHAIIGTWTPPGDKSISHRAVILGALAHGRSVIQCFLEADDCMRTMHAIQALGVAVSKIETGEYIVQGCGATGLQTPKDVLDFGNSGTGLRLMAGVLAGQPFQSVLTGDDSIRRRPMKRIVEPLRSMGVTIDGQNNANNAPLSIQGGNLHGIRYISPVASAQVKSCILLAGLFAEGMTQVIEPSLSRDHTERMLAGFGYELEHDHLSVSLKGGQKLSACDVIVPGDISSAAFFLVAALLVPNSNIFLENVGLNPTRMGILDVLNAAGAEIQVMSEYISGGEPIGDLQVSTHPLKAMSIDADFMPRLIDEIPILAVAATQAHGETVITGAQELRVKESDRLSTITQELRKMGAQIEETPDGLIISGPTPLKGAIVESHNDHRISMSLAIAALIAEGDTTINNTECIETSFPTFEASLRELVRS